MQTTWTVTQREFDVLVRGATRCTWRQFLPLLLGIAAGIPVLAGMMNGWNSLWVGIPVGALLAAGSALSMRRAVRKAYAAQYPVGSTAWAEAREMSLVLGTAAGAAELPWSRLKRPRVSNGTVLVKDDLSGQLLLIPRPLFPDEWLPRVRP